MDKHLTLINGRTTDLTYAEPEIGDVLDNGATILALTKQTERIVGDSYASWTTVCYKSGSDYHPFVVWTVIARPDGFMAETGNYAFTLTEAMKYYENRGGK